MTPHKKNQLRAECRKLWEHFDPIGVSSFNNGTDGEYDCYIPQTMRLIVAAADQYKITSFVQNCVYVNMGLPRTQSRDEAIRQFAQKLSEIVETSQPTKT